MSINQLFVVMMVVLGFSTCAEKTASTPQPITKSSIPSLKSAYIDDFTIGAALSATQINGEDPKAKEVIEREFSTITSENIMKSMYIHPERDSFYFEMSDKFVALGEKNKMFVVGHALIWHSQLSKWLEEIKDKDEMSKAIDHHIKTIVSKYQGRINGWDVVNEALNEDGTLRESVFWKVMGPDYLPEVFKAAALADPKAELYYNDYNLCRAEKREGVVKLVKQIQAGGAKIDGVGLQAHWSLNDPPLEEIEKSILAYSELGMKVMFTEMDITCIPNPWDLEGADVDQNFEGSPFMNPYPTSLPDSVQVQLANRYEDIFKLFLKHKDKISRVTFWGVNDGHSWLNNWPIKNRTQYPLLFDREFKAKKAYYSVLGLKK